MPGPESLELGRDPEQPTLPGTTSGPGNIANPTGAPIINPRKDDSLMGNSADPGHLAAPELKAERAASTDDDTQRG
jgi:hypothetical protein